MVVFILPNGAKRQQVILIVKIPITGRVMFQGVFCVTIVQISAGHLVVTVEVMQICRFSIVLVDVKFLESKADGVKEFFAVDENSFG